MRIVIEKIEQNLRAEYQYKIVVQKPLNKTAMQFHQGCIKANVDSLFESYLNYR